MIYSNKENEIKELKEKINHLKLEFKNCYLIKNENKKRIETSLKYNKLIENNNYNITQSIKNVKRDKIDDLSESKSQIKKNKIENPICINNNYSKFKINISLD
jgi:predicted ATP-dependent serine protease